MLRERLPEVDLAEAFCVCLNGARIPSMADDVATDLNTLRLRAAELRRYGLLVERVELMAAVYQWTREWEQARA